MSYPAIAFQMADKPDWITRRLTTWHGIYGPLFEWRNNFPDSRPAAVADFERMVRASWGTIHRLAAAENLRLEAGLVASER